MKRFAKAVVLTALWLLTGICATAETRATAPDAPRPTVINSDRLEFDYREYVALFEGNVRVKDPQFDLTSDRLLVFFEGTNDLRQVNAIGNVTIESDGRKAYCDNAVYEKARERIVMTGNARLLRENDEVRGDRITIWLDDERVVSVPGHLSISPETQRQGDKDP